MCWSSLIRFGLTRLNTLPTPAFASASVIWPSESSWTCCSFSSVFILASSASTFCSICLSGADLAGARASSSLDPPAANAAPPVSAIVAATIASLPLPIPMCSSRELDFAAHHARSPANGLLPAQGHLIAIEKTAAQSGRGAALPRLTGGSFDEATQRRGGSRRVALTGGGGL